MCRVGRKTLLNQSINQSILATDAARRPGLNVLLCGERLLQRYVVDTCAKMEQHRLNYLPFNHNSLRMLTLFWRMTDITPNDVCAQFYA